MSEKSTVYECVDREHDAWRCRACGYIENFEADGPTENGWHFCPGCGREIIVEAVNPCPFDNDNCMCQFCETPCNNGLNCSDCAHEGKAVHNVFLCTGFDGSVKQYVANWKRKQMEELGGERERKCIWPGRSRETRTTGRNSRRRRRSWRSGLV